MSKTTYIHAEVHIVVRVPEYCDSEDIVNKLRDYLHERLTTSVKHPKILDPDYRINNVYFDDTEEIP